MVMADRLGINAVYSVENGSGGSDKVALVLSIVTFSNGLVLPTYTEILALGLAGMVGGVTAFSRSMGIVQSPLVMAGSQISPATMRMTLAVPPSSAVSGVNRHVPC